MYLFMAVAYVLGGALLGGGFYLTRQDAFPGWWQGWMLWPLVRVTPRVVHLQGWAGVSLGISVLAVGFTQIAPEVVGGVLVLTAMAAYMAGVVLYGYSAYLSRRATN